MNVKELRDKLGWSQAKLAREIGVSGFTVCRWETGRSKPSPLAQEKLDKLSKRKV